MTWIVTKTRAGKAMRATAQDQDAARLMGINVNRTISFTFALGGALAGAAAIMYEQTVGTTRYDAGFQLGLIAFTAAVLGGIGNLTGAVLGGVLIGLIQGLNDGLPYAFGQEWSQSVVFTVLILVMVFKPTPSPESASRAGGSGYGAASPGRSPSRLPPCSSSSTTTWTPWATSSPGSRTPSGNGYRSARSTRR